ncbi:hypothetical protein [Lysinibacillus sp. RC79]|uniref:hypothetical protein n=1 Tax=Lysinibacillus sp. RC79 TaxID=3156296 RepID=UPI00351644A1
MEGKSNRVDKSFLSEWIEKITNTQQEHIALLLIHLKEKSNRYIDLTQELTRIKKSLSYNSETQNLVHLVDMAISKIEDEKNALHIQRADD